MATRPPLLRIAGLTKAFPGLRALDGVSFEVQEGEIVALIGQNGSGKSTLVKTLAGVHVADAGTVELRAGDDGDGGGAELHFIHQDLALVSMLSTIENLDLGRPVGARDFGPARTGRERHRAERLLAELGVALDVRVPVAELAPAERTMVAIARALDGWSNPANVLVLDEPTAALHGDEVRRLLDVVRQVARRGAGVIYISHRLDEVIELADRVLVLRDGRLVAEAARGAFGHDELVQMMAGVAVRDPGDWVRDPGAVRLSVRGLRTAHIDQADFEVRGGEIVGVTGILGSGREQLAGALFGAQPRTAGTVLVDGKAVRPHAPRASIRCGMAYVPADRGRDGAVATLTARENLTLPRLASVATRRGIDRRRERGEAESWFGRVGLRPLEPERRFGLFSGGNQQKIVLARSLRLQPSVVVLDEPTQGVDVSAKDAIYELIGEAATAGAAVVVASSDTKELASICDRVLVLRDGRIAAELARDGLSESRLTAAELGVGPSELEQLFGSTSEDHDAPTR